MVIFSHKVMLCTILYKHDAWFKRHLVDYFVAFGCRLSVKDSRSWFPARHITAYKKEANRARASREGSSDRVPPK